MGAAVIRGYQNDPYGKADRMNEVNKEMVNDQMVNGLAASSILQLVSRGFCVSIGRPRWACRPMPIILMRKRNLHKKSEKVAYALVYVIFLYYLCAGNNRSS